MRDAHLDDPSAGSPELDQQLGREEGTARCDTDPLERRAAEQLAGAVDIADPEAEPDPVRQPIDPGIERPHERIGSNDAEADDGVGRVRLAESLEQATQVGDAELPIAIGEGDELAA
jgi:hypothetical protein